ncbi:hypothetical protein CH373_15390 [Leptospira perolatii]|uniref:Uncharacterized protein n=1 Tax=Leptospira perolatii TaxID=2023191 RepID=A0A2M9ZJS5_9LEPT|nr:hypothetical protein CH360_10730 [Leptospira perolatii]PJZ72299.1 hypothetical protein CH373_15390 [Leptospira perolatii]
MESDLSDFANILTSLSHGIVRQKIIAFGLKSDYKITMKKIVLMLFGLLFVSCLVVQPGQGKGGKKDCMEQCRGLTGRERADCNHHCQR